MSRNPPITLTTADRSIVEGMLHCEGGHTGPRAFALRRKLGGATIVSPGEIAADIATLSSRVKFRVDDGDAEERTLVTSHAEEILGLTLLAWTSRGLALLGMSAGQQARILRLDGTPETITLEAVLYQPEAHLRTNGITAIDGSSQPTQSRGSTPALAHRLRRPPPVLVDPGGDDDGPSAA
jgi:regulator of nucleoside diphosphate kinase